MHFLFTSFAASDFQTQSIEKDLVSISPMVEIFKPAAQTNAKSIILSP
jgi:hypothetical protein